MKNPKTRSNTSILISLFFAVLVDMLGVGIVVVVMAPYIKESTHLFSGDVSDFQRNTIYLLLIAVFGLAQFLGAPYLGNLSDQHGRKKLVITTMVGGAIGYLIFSLGVIYANIALLFIGRFITGFNSGGVSIIYSIIADLSSPENRSKNFGILGAAFGIGFIIGPVLGSLLADESIVSWFNESTPFLTAMCLSLLSALLVWMTVPETYTPSEKERVRYSIFAGFQNIQNALRIPELISILSVLFFIYLGFTFFTQYSAVYLIDSLDFTERELGRFFAFIGTVLFITQAVILGFFSKKYSPRQIVALVLLSLSMGLAIFLVPKSAKSIFYVSAIIPFSFGMLQPNMLSIISNSASANIQGQILGIQQSIRSLAFTLPPIFSIWLSALNVKLPIIIGSALVFVAWVIFIVNYNQFSISKHYEDSKN